MQQFIKILFVVVMSMVGLCGFAQRQNVLVYLYVRDASTKETINDAKIIIMNEDSVALDTLRAFPISSETNLFRYFGAVPEHPSYIINVERKHYEQQTAKFSFSDFKKGIPTIYIQRETVQLDEVTVTGSRILMINKGDTIVYNASALQLSHGSMLDALIKRLPGVEINQSGHITVNGKYVNTLMINGRDFFKNDNKIALSNLPAYYVDKIKVYHKLSDARLVMYGDSAQIDTDKDPYVMDVRLKRDYAEGWLANTNFGLGTSRKYLAKLFAMRYTRHSGLFIYGNTNNKNDEEEANKNGGWAGRSSFEGQKRLNSAGISYDGDDKLSGVEWNTSAKINTSNINSFSVSSIDNYFAAGNVYQRTQAESEVKRTTFNWDGTFHHQKPMKWDLNFRPNVSYVHTHTKKISQSAYFTESPFESHRGAALDSLYARIGSWRLNNILINLRKQVTLGTNNSLSANAMLFTLFKMAGKWATLTFTGAYSESNVKEHYYDNLRYNVEAEIEDEMQYRYSILPTKNYNYRVTLGITLLEKKRTSNSAINLRTELGYQQTYSSGERTLYNLHQYDSQDALPSTIDSLQTEIDIRNSYLTSTLTQRPSMNVNFKWGHFNLSIPLTITFDKMNDYRGNQPNHISRNKPSVSPLLYYSLNSNNKQIYSLYTSYQFQMILPNLVHMLDVRDDSDPLVVSLGNPDLKSTSKHMVNFKYSRVRSRHQQTLNAEYYFELIHKAVTMGRLFDTHTGISTIRPDNINGNWKNYFTIDFGQQLDNKRRLAIRNKTHIGFGQSVDYSTTYTEGQALLSQEQSKVKNFWMDETLKCILNTNDWHAEVLGHIGGLHSESHESNLQTINAIEYNYGLSVSKSIKGKFNIDSELMMWSRRGYADSNMNTDEFIWNASISYAFGKSKSWVAKLEGCDIFQNRNSVRQNMNAQGRTETWFKTIPSYGMLHLIYQLKKAPKKRNQDI